MTTPSKHRAAPAKRHHLAPAQSSPASSLHEFGPASAGARDVHIKRIYDEPARSDGRRVLVDRIWPRGIKKQDAALDEWLRDLAPSTKLRQWFGHDPKRWSVFRTRYRAELRRYASQLNALRQHAAHERVTLLYGARNEQFNQAVVLQELLQGSKTVL